MLIFLYGPDTFRSREQLKKIMDKFKADRDPQGFNTVILNCEKEEAGEIMERIMAVPFLSEKRMVVLENFLTSKHKELQKELLVRIGENTLPQSTVLVFWEGWEEFTGKEAKAMAEKLSKEKFAQRFEGLTGARLNVWITRQLKERGAKINSDALDYLMQNAGQDMWKLNSLLDQLASYSENPKLESKGTRNLSKKKNNDELKTVETGTKNEITLENVCLFLDEKIDDNIFNLAEAIAGKQTKQAYQMIQEQYRQGEEPSYLFAMILRQFRILLELRDLFEKEDCLSSEVLAKRLKLHPFAVKKSLPLVKRYNLAELKNIYKQLLELDIKTKTGQADQSLLLDLFVGKISQS